MSEEEIIDKIMLSEEEKKAIEELKNFINDKACIYWIGKNGEETVKIILNLIKNQQKEIESLKKENLEIRDWKYTIDTIEDLDKLKELDLIKIKGKEYISKDKIREKIKKYDEWIKEDGDYVESLEAQRYALNELLEE